MNEKEFMEFVDKNIIKLVEKNKIITKEILPERMNSYSWNYIIPFLDNELLIENVKYYILQAFNEFKKTPYYHLDGSYNKTLKHKLIHILLERLELQNELIQELNEMIDDI